MNAGKLELSDLGRLVLDRTKPHRGMSLREAALTIGIPFNTLARVEKGTRTRPPEVQETRRVVWGRHQSVL